MRRGVILAIALSLAAPVSAEMRPVQRPDIAKPTTPSGIERRVVKGTALAPTSSLRPVVRGGAKAAIAPQSTDTFAARIAAVLNGPSTQAASADVIQVAGLQRSMRPSIRPKSITKTVQRLKSGAACGRASIKATRIPSINGKGGCGVQNAVKVTEVSGVRLSQAATVECGTAKALDDWVRKGAIPAVGRYGGGVTSLRVVSHYSCRSRQSRRGRVLSEHAKGKAIDIAGIGLANGTELTVLTDWKTRREGRMLKAMWRAACGPFGTVLGPEANAAHLDHFHFDIARYRGKSYCR